MIYQVSEEEIRMARAPHNLFVSSVLLFNLLLTPAAIALKVGLYGFLIPLVFSGAVIVFTFNRSRRTTRWFADAHWKLAFRRCQFLMIGYAVTAGFLLLAWVASLAAHDANMKHIVLTALTRIAVMPTLIAVMVTAVLEASAAAQAGRGEVPDGIVKRFPPPEGTVQS